MKAERSGPTCSRSRRRAILSEDINDTMACFEVGELLTNAFLCLFWGSEVVFGVGIAHSLPCKLTEIERCLRRRNSGRTRARIERERKTRAHMVSSVRQVSKATREKVGRYCFMARIGRPWWARKALPGSCEFGVEM